MIASKQSKRGKNWEVIDSRDPKDTLVFRDVHGEQQLERSRPQAKAKLRNWMIGGAAIAFCIALLTYFLVSIIGFGVSALAAASVQGSAAVDAGSAAVSTAVSDVTTYYEEVMDTSDAFNGLTQQFYEVDEAGNRISGPYDDIADIPVPDWFVSEVEAEGGHVGADGTVSTVEDVDYGAMFGEAIAPGIWNVLLSILACGITLAVWYQFAWRQVKTQNVLHDTSDINQHYDDQHIMLVEEMQQQFDYFPDVGAHSSVQVSSMISHMMIANKGLGTFYVTQRVEKDILDEDGEVAVYAGEPLEDVSGEIVKKAMPIIDKEFGDALFDASGLSVNEYRRWYDATKIPYNPGNKDREKLKGFDTVADLINGDWEFPEYEVQRPAGAYLVDTAPVNTMVLAITRAGKGQTVIEPTLDMWSREKEQQNMIVNDPKGELLRMNYVPFTVRGYQMVQFNLINALKTDIYNPLALAAQSAREGDSTKCAMYVENIAEVFFPLDGGEDPVWPNAANNAFKRAAYGLIDFYLEEERELRARAEVEGIEPGVLETMIDNLWGKVTLYNCYQLFVQLSSKKLENPAVKFNKDKKAGKFDQLSDAEFEQLKEEAEAKADLWDDAAEIDLLSLYFNATKCLPVNQMRTLVKNADNALRAMGAAEKMLASVYGIAITAMSFFTDPTISTLTSGTLSQNVDLAGLSFPRRIGFRMHADFVASNHLVGMQAQWQAFSDPKFEQSLGKEFYHEDMIGREGWCRFYFKGKFPNEVAYLRCRILNPQTGMRLKTFYFKFTKGHQMSLNGKYYVTDPVLDEKIVKDGVLEELVPDGKGSYVPGKMHFKSRALVDVTEQPEMTMVSKSVVISTMTRYSEKPKAVFLVTPPHLMKYAKLILILIKQLVDLNFDQSYMTKSNQKPLYKSRFMLDELGNLQSEGHGISGFETMLSIGLGQEQQFSATSCYVKSMAMAA